MKKIVILVPAGGSPLHVIDFAAKIAMNENCLIDGLFLGNLKAPDEPYSEGNLTRSAATGEENRLVKTKIKDFEDACKAKGLAFTSKLIDKNHMEVALDETAFADLVLCNNDMYDPRFSMNNFVSSLHCPVLLIPDNDLFFKEIIFTYDGSISSILAMKLFTYLFPWCRNYKVYIVSVLPIDTVQLEYDALVREWITLHYPKSEIIILHGEVRSEISEFINAGKNNIVVMGAFGRSLLSRLVKESLGMTILQRTNSPLFIAHM